MKQETRRTLRNYAICVAVELVIAFLVIWSKGFLVHSKAVNLQILADAFFVAGILMTLFAGLVYVSSEGALVGVQYVLRNAVLIFFPMGRARIEPYRDYRERKMAALKERSNACVIITGLSFLFIGLVLTFVWYKMFYQI